MKKDGKYRFSLQFGSETEEEILVGDFLERIGNKKSEFIIPVIADYLLRHPELQPTNVKIAIKFATIFSRNEMEMFIRSIVEERLAELHDLNSRNVQMKVESDAIGEDVVRMLDNLNFFQ